VVLFVCQAREKFVSVRKGTRAEVVTELEEARCELVMSLFFRFCFILIYGVDECIYSFHVVALILSLQDLHNAKSAFERCRFNLVCISTFFHMQVYCPALLMIDFAVRNSGTCPCEH
jgi:hypothetical protein